jgi:hypothetical protein
MLFPPLIRVRKFFLLSWLHRISSSGMFDPLGSATFWVILSKVVHDGRPLLLALIGFCFAHKLKLTKDHMPYAEQEAIFAPSAT